MRKLHLFLLATFTILANNSVNAQEKILDDSEKYLLKYSTIAVEQMEKYGIPASITLAQGLLESGAGKSKLAIEANNHFGIKADNRWDGETYSSFDNGNWHKFRVYDNAEKSFEDHSQFLAGSKRYEALFSLDPKDYKGWAQGLKNAYYAEDREYDKKLISIIDRYELNKYDNHTVSAIRGNSKATQEVCRQDEETKKQRVFFKTNGKFYVVTNNGDNINSLSKELEISKRKIRKYNDLYNEYVLKEGDIVYIEKKSRKAAKGVEFHTTKSRESLHKISQIYGIKLKSLYRLNPQYESYTTLNVGDVIRLR